MKSEENRAESRTIEGKRYLKSRKVEEDQRKTREIDEKKMKIEEVVSKIEEKGEHPEQYANDRELVPACGDDPEGCQPHKSACLPYLYYQM